MSDDSPTLADVFEAAIDAALKDVRVWLPGEVRSYDAVSRRAIIQVMVPDGWIEEDGQRRTTTLKPMTDVPAALCGSGSTRVKFPIRPGDPCLVLFSSSCITAYKATGRLIDHGDDRHHHEADAFFVPMPRVVGEVEGDPMIEFTEDGEIHAGGDQDLALKQDVTALKNAVSTLLQTLASAGISPITGTAVAAAKATFDTALATVPAGTDTLKGA